MKNNVLYLLPAILFLLPACQREEVQPEDNDQTPGGPQMVSVTIDQETRATVSDWNGAIAFSSGDIIKIYNGTGVYWGVTASTTDSGLFSMQEGFTASGNGFAGFPSNLVSSITSDGVAFTLPGTYDYTAVGGSDINSSKVPCPMIGDFSGGDGISLKPACAIMRFYITDVKAGSLAFSFSTPVTGTTSAIATPSGTNDGILASTLSEAGKTITVTGVPDVAVGCSICITLPVPTGTKPQNIRVLNRLEDGTTLRSANITGSGNGLARAGGHKLMVSSFVKIEAVDLGLSVKWASINMDASSETDYGDYFAWGEVEPYYSSLSPLAWKTGKSEGYYWPSYQWGNGSSFTKYTGSDDKPVLDLSDDAAHVNWGGSWRMPTKAEFEELQALPSEWVSNYNNTGVAGRMFTATNGKSIFLPAAGYRLGTGLGVEGYRGCYWSSSLDTDSPGYAWYWDFTSSDAYCLHNLRCTGFSVRPVYQGEAPAITLASVEVSPNSVTVQRGETLNLSATAKDTQGNTLSGASITWSVVSGSSASVNSSGYVTVSAITTGPTIIRATAVYNGVTKTADCTVIVDYALAVDLGLSVKWANMNVGAMTVTAQGNLYAWGETTPKSNYDWPTYKWGTSDNLTKYSSSDGKTVLELSDDAARANWGGSWRMPTKAECEALINGTDQEWVSNYQGTGISGRKFMKKSDHSKYIFLPAVGGQNAAAVYGDGEEGYYWSSSRGVNVQNLAYELYVTSETVGTGSTFRSLGFPVRPVQP